MSLSFDDGSKAVIKTGAETSGTTSNKSIPEAKGKTIKSVQQKGATMTLAFEDGTSAEIALAEATSSVMVRDKAGAMQYAD